MHAFELPVICDQHPRNFFLNQLLTIGLGKSILLAAMIGRAEALFSMLVQAHFNHRFVEELFHDFPVVLGQIALKKVFRSVVIEVSGAVASLDDFKSEVTDQK